MEVTLDRHLKTINGFEIYSLSVVIPENKIPDKIIQKNEIPENKITEDVKIYPMSTE